MTGSNGGNSRVCLIAAAGLVLVSCDKVPTRPDNPAPPPSGPSVQRSTGPLAFVSNRDGTDAIYLANEDGSAITRLTEGWGPAWSRDGRRIAFVRARNIYVVNVDGSGLQSVTQGTYPSWSPDGSRLAFADSSIYIVDTNGSNRRELFDDEGYGAFGPVWSPDGRRIAFSVGTYSDISNELFGLWTVSPDGSGAQRPRSLVEVWAPAWSPDGSQIAFLTFSGIGVASMDGSGQTIQVAGEFLSVDWTPSGRLIYTRFTTGDHAGPSRIFISDGVERQLIPDATAPARLDYRDWQVAWLR